MGGISKFCHGIALVIYHVFPNFLEILFHNFRMKVKDQQREEGLQDPLSDHELQKGERE